MAEQKGQVAFIGLGVMGYPMAGHLVKQGYSVSVYNRTGSKAAKASNSSSLSSTL